MEVREVYFMHVSNFKWNGSNFQVREAYFMHVSYFKWYGSKRSLFYACIKF